MGKKDKDVHPQFPSNRRLRCRRGLLLDRVADLGQGVYPVTLIPGDGIGPEISESVEKIFAAAKVVRELTTELLML